MAYDRYDTRMRRGSRYDNDFDDRSPRGDGRNVGRERMRDLDYDRGDRDFFDRASDEVRSWFGDDRAERRRELDERMGAGRGYVGQRYNFENGLRRTDEGYRVPYDERSYSRQWDRGSDARSNPQDNYDYDRAYTQNRFGRPMTQSEFTGRGTFDDDYSNWRNQQIDQLDNDYAEWRSENARRFDDEFTNWRSERMTKREMMRTIPTHAEVVDCEGEHVGTIDKVVGDRMILTRNDSDDGHHHSLSCRHLETVDGNTVKLNLTAEKAKDEWRDEDRSRALGEKFEGDEGPRMLNRSFSNTY